MRGRGDKQLHKKFQYFEYKQYQIVNKLCGLFLLVGRHAVTGIMSKMQTANVWLFGMLLVCYWLLLEGGFFYFVGKLGDSNND